MAVRIKGSVIRSILGDESALYAVKHKPSQPTIKIFFLNLPMMDDLTFNILPKEGLHRSTFQPQWSTEDKIKFSFQLCTLIINMIMNSMNSI